MVRQVFALLAFLPFSAVMAQSPQPAPARPAATSMQSNPAQKTAETASTTARPKVIAPGRPAFAPSAASQGRTPQAPLENKKAPTTR